MVSAHGVQQKFSIATRKWRSMQADRPPSLKVDDDPSDWFAKNLRSHPKITSAVLNITRYDTVGMRLHLATGQATLNEN